MEVDENKIDKLLDAFGHNCDYLYSEVYGGYCVHGILNNEPNKCRNCQFRNIESIKEWLKDDE